MKRPFGDIELEDGGYLEIEADNGDIRYRDDVGCFQGIWSIGDDDWKHYADAFGVTEDDFVYCEVCEGSLSEVGPFCPKRAVDGYQVCLSCRPALEQLAECGE